MNTSSSKDSLVNSSKSVFFCPSTPHLIWDLRQIISHQIAIAVTAAACPFTILLNISVIVAVKKIKELQTNPNILIAGLAVADLLVGAVAMPLSITLDALILRGTVSEDIICTISDITGFVQYTASSVSYYYLILIAWERYVAIVKCMEYKVIVTKGRVKRYAGIVWITALPTTALFGALGAAGVCYEVLLVLDVIFSLIWLMGFSLMVYFYRMIYMEIRKRNQSQISQESALIKARAESKLAYTVFLLTVAVFISSVPAIAFFVMAIFSPFFRAKSVFRWAEIFFQLNSLVNPALYFYRNNRCRKATLKLLRFGKPQEIQPARVGRRVRRHRDSVASIDVGDFVDSERAPRLRRSQSYAGETHGHRNTGCGVSAGRVINRRMSAPSLTSHGNLRDAEQSVTPTVTLPIEDALKISNDGNDNKKSHRRKMTRSKPLNENAFAETTTARQNTAKVNSQRRNSSHMD